MTPPPMMTTRARSGRGAFTGPTYCRSPLGPGELVVEPDHRGRPQPELVVGAQHPVAVDVDPELLVDRRPGGMVPAAVGHDDVRAVLAEGARRRAQLQRPVR